MPATYAKVGSPSSSKSGISIIVDTKALSRLAADLRLAAPEAWKACRVALKAAGEIVAADARARTSYSSRIPGSVKVRTTSGGNVKVVAGGARAENAAPIENRGKGFVRHPVFGDREDWTAKNSRPAFLAPALAAHMDEVATAVENAIAIAVERALDSGL
jgi:hypothetical protein